MNLEKAKKKLKIYNALYIAIIILIINLFILIFNNGTTGANIFAFSIIPLIICTIIFKSKKKYYKQLVYDLSTYENAIIDTINDKNLK